jgi:hypothetical protein
MWPFSVHPTCQQSSEDSLLDPVWPDDAIVSHAPEYVHTSYDKRLQLVMRESMHVPGTTPMMDIPSTRSGPGRFQLLGWLACFTHVRQAR